MQSILIHLVPLLSQPYNLKGCVRMQTAHLFIRDNGLHTPACNQLFFISETTDCIYLHAISYSVLFCTVEQPI